MNTLQIEDVFEPYYVGRKPFLASRPAAKRADDRTAPPRQTDAKPDSPAAKPDTVTEH